MKNYFSPLSSIILVIMITGNLFLFTAIQNESKKQSYRQKIKEYMDRAEKIKETVEQQKEGI